jgi:predicted CXXCH cytochrome family protein
MTAFIIVTASVIGPRFAAGAGVELLIPFDGAVVHTPQVLAVYTAPPGAKGIVQRDGRSLSVETVAVPGDEQDLHHGRIHLTEGRQRIRWIDGATESELAAATVTYIPPYSLRTAAAPGDRPYAFHTRTQETGCRDCHNLPEVFETIPDRPLAPAGKVCAACHPGVVAAPQLHGPVAVYSCFMCHSQAFSPARFTWKVPQGGTCDACHKGYLARILGAKKHVHGPVAAGVCLACHAPHGGQTSMLLRATPPDLCLVCHAETLPMPVSKELHGQVPCTRCHEPHGSDNESLISRRGAALCGGCHDNVLEMQTKGHPMAQHPVEAPVDPSRPGTPMGCTSCHDVHGLQDVSTRGISEDPPTREQFCRRCHY